jgi:endonuclease/exonuclease/phosphatase family metal-dependent hydrolase
MTLFQSPSISRACDGDHVKVSLNMLCYNVFMRPFVYTNSNGDYKDARLNALLDYFPHFDIVALQEMFTLGSSRSQLMINSCIDMGLRYHVSIGSDFWRSMKPIDSGLFIISRYPIVEKDYIVFSQGKDIDGWSTKGVLSALIQITNQTQILVMTTHLQAEYDNQDVTYNRIQESQLLEMKQFLRKKREQYPDIPMILMGDFNIDARVPVIGEYDPSIESETYRNMMQILSWKTLNEEEIVTNRTYSAEQEHTRNHNTYENVDGLESDWRDVVKECLGGIHPVTFADARTDPSTNTLTPVDTLLTHPLTLLSRVRLDYIFYYNENDTDVQSNIGVLKDIADISERGASYTTDNLDKIGKTSEVPTNTDESSDCIEQIILKPGSSRVEPFFVDGHDFGQLSDHYALTCTLQVVDSELYQQVRTSNNQHESTTVVVNEDL